MWVEAKGPAGDKPLVTIIEELRRGPFDKSDKLEISAPAEEPEKTDSVRVLGKDVKIVPKTTYENLARKAVSPFAVPAGDWVKVKARRKEGDQLQARTIRRLADAGRFRVEGEIQDLDPAAHSLLIGGLPLQVAKKPQVQLLGEAAGIDPSNPLSFFQADERKSVPFTVQLSERIHLGGEIMFKVNHRDESDLDSSRPRDRTDVTEQAKVDLFWQLSESGSFFLVEGTAGRRDRFRELNSSAVTDSASVSRAYAHLALPDGLRLVVGRQDFDEEREWLYDEVLDGIRMVKSFGDFDLEASASTGREILEEKNETENTYTLIGLTRYHIDRHHRVTAYVVQRKDTSLTNLEPLVYGLRSYSQPSKGLGHWVELSRSEGFEQRTKIDGYAVDVGLSYRFDIPLRPTVTVAYALGTGPRGSSVGYRQTGLQDNNGKFGSVTSFRYYGEVFEPNLSNMQITTVGLGVRPVRSFSVDVVFHTYRQDVALDSIVKSRLRTAPNGFSRDLGWEVDLIVGHRLGNRFNAELVAGRFDPGDAFDKQDAAQRIQLQLRVKF